MNRQQPMNFHDVLTSIRNTDSTLDVLEATASEIEILPEAFRLGTDSFKLPKSSRRRLLRIVGAPAAYLERMGPVIIAQAMSEHFRRGDFGHAVTIAIRGREVFGISRSDLVQLQGGDVLNAVAEGLGAAASSLSVARIEDTGDRVALELVSRAKSVEVRTGDVIEGGLHIVHHRFGPQPTVIQAFMLRLVCSNRMTARRCVSDGGIVRTPKLSVTHPNAIELQLDQIRRLAVRNWEALEPRLSEMFATPSRLVDVESVFGVARRWR
jgi:hypothetical protein